MQDVLNIIWIGGELGAFGAEGFKMFVEVVGKAQFAIYTANARLAAFNVNHLNLFLWREEFVHSEHVANIGVAGVGLALAGGVSDHFTHALDSLFGGEREFNVIIETLAHLFLAVNAQHFQHFGVFDLRLDQDLGLVAVVEGTYNFTRKFKVRSLVNANWDNISFVE